MSSLSFGFIFILMIACFSANTSSDEIDDLREKIGDQLKSFTDLMKSPFGLMVKNKDMMVKLRERMAKHPLKKEMEKVIDEIFPYSNATANKTDYSSNPIPEETTLYVEDIIKEISSEIKSAENRFEELIKKYTVPKPPSGEIEQSTAASASNLPPTTSMDDYLAKARQDTAGSTIIHKYPPPTYKPVVKLPLKKMNDAMDEYLKKQRDLDQTTAASAKKERMKVNFPNEEIEQAIDDYLRKSRKEEYERFANEEADAAKKEVSTQQATTVTASEVATKEEKPKPKATQSASSAAKIDPFLGTMSDIVDGLETGISKASERLEEILDGLTSTPKTDSAGSNSSTAAINNQIIDKMKSAIKVTEEKLNNMLNKIIKKKGGIGNLDKWQIIEELQNEIKAADSRVEQILDDFWIKEQRKENFRFPSADLDFPFGMTSDTVKNMMEEIRILSGLDFSKDRLEDMIKRYFLKKEVEGSTTQMSKEKNQTAGDSNSILNEQDILDQMLESIKLDSDIPSNYNIKEVFQRFFSNEAKSSTIKPQTISKQTTTETTDLIGKMKSKIRSLYSIKDKLEKVFSNKLRRKGSQTENRNDQNKSKSPENDKRSVLDNFSDYDKLFKDITSHFETNETEFTKEGLKDILKKHLDPKESYFDKLLFDMDETMKEVNKAIEKYMIKGKPIEKIKFKTKAPLEQHKSKPSVMGMLGHVIKERAKSVIPSPIRTLGKNIVDLPGNIIGGIRNKVSKLYNSVTKTENNQSNYNNRIPPWVRRIIRRNRRRRNRKQYQDSPENL